MRDADSSRIWMILSPRALIATGLAFVNGSAAVFVFAPQIRELLLRRGDRYFMLRAGVQLRSSGGGRGA